MSPFLIPLLLGVLLVYPALSQGAQNLTDGVYLFSSQPPDRSRHPDIQLAGAEVYVFWKKGRQVIGERLIANSSDANCFRGNITGRAIAGEGISLPFPVISGKIERFKLNVNLEVFKLLPLSSLTYSKGSIQRCVKQFEQYGAK
jgi:hypothetical protein